MGSKRIRWLAAAGVVLAGAALVGRLAAERPAGLIIDYPLEGSIFPPDFPAPTFLWRDDDPAAHEFRIEVRFANGSANVVTPGPLMQVGEIDPRAVSDTNKPPELTPQQAASHTWKPEPAVWEAIRKSSVFGGATITISGPNSRASVTIRISKDPVGAPIFYRDVPLMPSETEKGIIKPLAATAIPLIAWRLRNPADTSSRLVLTGMRTCANCHSFSNDGKTLGMDLDGPGNDKGLYALADVKPQMAIRTSDMISWKPKYEEETAKDRVGFMSQVSPDGRYVLTRLSGPKATLRTTYYVMNFKDYRFLQVFYPTRGIMVSYNRATREVEPLGGADDPRYAQADGVWSPDGKYVVFARAPEKDPYPEGWKPALFANDPGEIQIQYDLYRVPFNGGRGGVPQRIEGASENGLSNTFPKVSPDGKWIVFVRCRNGQLMRPDSQLYIVPAAGGIARLMRCNTSLMNSWHSFSPNGRWMVFSSKSRSPYTQMYLTHIDESGNDSPAILVENATAANRAVNIPEFVNIPPNGLMKIDVPAVDFYTQFDVAFKLSQEHNYEAAIPEWEKALKLDPDDARAHVNLGIALAETGRPEAALDHYRRAAEIEPGNPLIVGRLAAFLSRAGRADEAIPWFEKTVRLNPRDAAMEMNLAMALASTGKVNEAIAHLESAARLAPGDSGIQTNLGAALAMQGRTEEALQHLTKALEDDPNSAEAHYHMGVAWAQLGRPSDAIVEWRKSLTSQPDNVLALNRLAQLLATDENASLRNGAEAVRLAERAAELTDSQDAALEDTLAAAYAETGQFPRAVETARKALQLATDHGQGQLAEGVRARIALYESGRPLRAN